MKKLPWRVRVRLAVETWVDVDALSAKEAEELAAVLPNVLSVFGRSATIANMVKGQEPAEGVQEELL